MKAVLILLTAARNLLADPKHWTKGSSARTPRGTRVPTFHPQATRFCSVGALVRCGENDLEARALLTMAAQTLTGRDVSVIGFNDSRRTTHDDVLQMFDLAIQFAKVGEQS